MKYLVIAFLSISLLNAQDTLKPQVVYKNAIGISVNHGITGPIDYHDLFKDDDSPIYVPSYYIEYTRKIYGNFFINTGIGMFNYGSLSEYDQLGIDGNYTGKKEKVSFINSSLSLHLNPQIVLINNKKMIFYSGLSSQLNFYLTTLILGPSIKDPNIFESHKMFVRGERYPSPIIYTGINIGVGIKLGRVLLIAEPEFKMSLTAIIEKYNFLFYSANINLKCFYRF